MPFTADSPRELDRSIVEFITRRFDARESKERFNDLSLRLFRYQFANNRPYREFCRRRGVDDKTILNWKEIPQVPVVAFKETDLACEPPARAHKIFKSSGTTAGIDRRSSHLFFTLDLYDASARANFARHLMPDLDRLTMLFLCLPPRLAPDSSLSYMFESIRLAFGKPDSDFFVGRNGLDTNALLESVEQAGEVPVALFGTTAAFVRLFEQLKASNLMLHLPPGSRLMDTGGSKGLSREFPRAEFLAEVRQVLAIPHAYVVNEYGMTELSSQFYDGSLVNHLNSASAPPVKTIPPWTRVRVLSPDSLAEVPDGRAGLLAIVDLANRGSVMAILTEDIGIKTPHGFEVRGRLPGAESRGCSIAADEFFSALRG